MSLIEDWSVRLAQEVAPEEVEMAPVWGEAFAAGGEARKELLASTGSVMGAFDAAQFASIMPAVFGALSFAGPLLLAAVGAFTRKDTAEFLGLIKNGLTILEIRLRTGAAKKTADAKVQPPPAGTLVPDTPAFAPLARVMDAMSAELRASGMDADQSDLVTFRVLKVLLEEPEGAAQFVRQLTVQT